MCLCMCARARVCARVCVCVKTDLVPHPVPGIILTLGVFKITEITIIYFWRLFYFK